MSKCPQYLTRINSIEDVPNDAYIIYQMSGGIFYCKRKDYLPFSRFYTRTSAENLFLTMDLCSTPHHSLILDIDIKPQSCEPLPSFLMQDYIDSVILSSLKFQFLSLKHFTFIVATRPGGGIHVHLPEISIAHDDYIRLCGQLQPRFSLQTPDFIFHLDVLSNATLVNSSKPPTTKYEPIYIFYVDEQTTLRLDLTNPNGLRLLGIQSKFKRRKDNTNSYFRKLLHLQPTEIQTQIYEYMMPVATPYDPLYRVSYPTLISKEEEAGPDDEKVATFVYKLKTPMYIYKGRDFRIEGPHWLRAFYFIKFNGFVMSDFESTNRALTQWYRQSQRSIVTENDVFQTVNQALKLDNAGLHPDPNPLRTILQYNDGYYFLPVFYALCQHLRMSSSTLASHLRTLLECHELIDAVEKINSKIMDVVSQDFTLDTILFCGSNLNPQLHAFKEKLESIIKARKGILLYSASVDQLVDQIHRIQERYFPILVITMQNSCKKPQRYMWNLIHEYWQEVAHQAEVLNLMNAIWSSIQAFARSQLTHQVLSPFTEMIKQVNINYVVSSILSRTNIDRKVIQMDRHKWHIRTHDGVLDLLTGHVGGTVPEFYISDRRLGVNFSRHELIQYRHDRQLLAIYHLLTDRKFFRKYLKNLFLDLTDDLLDTLRETLREFQVSEFPPLVESMLHFYVHMCKYTCFDYDMFMYLLDVLASLLIATNYARKFFIFKGNTRNGKSKFFQMISKVFGGYSHGIRAVNLQTTSGQGLAAQPELASSLFCCRVVTVEEMSGKLNENLVKEITGNSTTSFRNLYEQNVGAIPSAKLMASTNTFPVCTATEAFTDRVVAIPFEAVFTKQAPSLTSEQVMQDEYLLETNDSIVEDSYKGFFLMTYLHLSHCINMEDGMIHYRPEPKVLLEFKEEFLSSTDIFTQFKQYADVQMIPGSVTTLNELRSAIRQFLKTIRDTSIHETELIMRFNQEFGHLKRTELDSFVIQTSASYLETTILATEPLQFENAELDNSLKRKHPDEEEEEEGAAKHVKCSNDEPNLPQHQKIVIYYDNIVIKNLKKDKNY